MLTTLSPTGLSNILQLLIKLADEYEVDENENGGNETNLSNLSASKKSIRAGYLTCKGTKKDGGKTKKGVKAAKGLIT